MEKDGEELSVGTEGNATVLPVPLVRHHQAVCRGRGSDLGGCVSPPNFPHPPPPNSLPSCLGCSFLASNGNILTRQPPSLPVHPPTLCQTPPSPLPSPPLETPTHAGFALPGLQAAKGYARRCRFCSQHLPGEGKRRGWSGVSVSLQEGREEKAEEQERQRQQVKPPPRRPVRQHRGGSCRSHHGPEGKERKGFIKRGTPLFFFFPR